MNNLKTFFLFALLTAILVRVGPMLGLMGTLIPLAPALEALANNDTATLANQLEIAFSVTVIGLLIGGLAFTISILRDRFYSQDISDLEYLLELLEGSGKRLRSGGGVGAGGKAKPSDEELEAAIAEEGIAAQQEILVADIGGLLPDEAAEAERRMVHVDQADVIGGRDLEDAPPDLGQGQAMAALDANEDALVGAETEALEIVSPGEKAAAPRSGSREGGDGA